MHHSPLGTFVKFILAAISDLLKGEKDIKSAVFLEESLSWNVKFYILIYLLTLKKPFGYPIRTVQSKHFVIQLLFKYRLLE
ncbi:MAG: hypothetical protein K0Q73_6693, partial [Paenibacillus sp.]|nr:hypothetical protein [Paenibacillus sp.]